MEPYIKKSALAAEIERLITELVEEGEDTMFEQGRISAFEDVKVFINHTLEVKDVDDEKCKEYDKALSIAKAWYKSSDSSAQERNVARMIMGDKVRE